jgi:hypothetical protein
MEAWVREGGEFKTNSRHHHCSSKIFTKNCKTHTHTYKIIRNITFKILVISVSISQIILCRGPVKWKGISECTSSNCTSVYTWDQ